MDQLRESVRILERKWQVATETYEFFKKPQNEQTVFSYAQYVIAEIQKLIDDYKLLADRGGPVNPGVRDALVFLIEQQDAAKRDMVSSAGYTEYWQERLDTLDVPSVEADIVAQRVKKSGAPIDYVQTWIGEVDEGVPQYDEVYEEFDRASESLGFHFIIRFYIVKRMVELLSGFTEMDPDAAAYAEELLEYIGAPNMFPDGVVKRFASICVDVSGGAEFDEKRVESELLTLFVHGYYISEVQLRAMDFHLLRCVMYLTKSLGVTVNESSGRWLVDLVRIYIERSGLEEETPQFVWFMDNTFDEVVTRLDAKRVLRQTITLTLQEYNAGTIPRDRVEMTHQAVALI